MPLLVAKKGVAEENQGWPRRRQLARAAAQEARRVPPARSGPPARRAPVARRAPGEADAGAALLRPAQGRAGLAPRSQRAQNDGREAARTHPRTISTIVPRRSNWLRRRLAASRWAGR